MQLVCFYGTYEFSSFNFFLEWNGPLVSFINVTRVIPSFVSERGRPRCLCCQTSLKNSELQSVCGEFHKMKGLSKDRTFDNDLAAEDEVEAESRVNREKERCNKCKHVRDNTFLKRWSTELTVSKLLYVMIHLIRVGLNVSEVDYLNEAMLLHKAMPFCRLSIHLSSSKFFHS